MTAPKPTRGGPRKGAGRPPLDPSDRASERVVVRVTTAEHARLVAWAGREGVSLSELARARLVRAAQR